MVPTARACSLCKVQLTVSDETKNVSIVLTLGFCVFRVFVRKTPGNGGKMLLFWQDYSCSNIYPDFLLDFCSILATVENAHGGAVRRLLWSYLSFPIYAGLFEWPFD